MNNVLFVIWCDERNAWWLPNSYGYTYNIDCAGRYSLKRANDICTSVAQHLDMSSKPPETMLVAPEYRDTI